MEKSGNIALGVFLCRTDLELAAEDHVVENVFFQLGVHGVSPWA